MDPSEKPDLKVKILLTRLKTLRFVACHMKKKILEVIHFHIKRRDRQGIVFVQTTFEKCNTNFHFENSKVGIKRTISNL